MKTTTKSVDNFGFHALVWKEGKWYVARAVEVEVASQGETARAALKNLKEALELYFEDEKIPAKNVTSVSDLRLREVYPNIRYA